MSLSIAEKNKLREEFHHVIDLVSEGKAFWENEENRESIIRFCIEHDIRLYNMAAARIGKAIQLLNELPQFLTLSSDTLEEEEKRLLQEKFLQWQNKFESAVRSSDKELWEIHQRDYANVAAQYRKTHSVSAETLLTLEDMATLLNQGFSSEDVLVSTPFSLTEISSEQKEVIQALITEAAEEGKTLLLPLVHDRHFFYLKKEEGTWSVEDSQPTLAEDRLTPRQQSIKDEAARFLISVGENTLGEDHSNLAFNTTSSQANDYDCGSQVINACRSIVDKDYTPKSHKGILKELLTAQLGEEEQPENLEAVIVSRKPVASLKASTAKIEQVIEATASAQSSPERAEQYKNNVSKLIAAVVEKGLFADIKNKLPLEHLDTAIANEKEKDGEFATRLQEAEFRKAGLT